jgi:hypothetical protein
MTGFVSLMDKVLEGFDEFADSFIDDIGIFSDTWEFHVEHLRAVFQSLREAKLVVKPSKCFDPSICQMLSVLYLTI